VKIALLTSRYPYPPDRGDRIAVLNLLRALAVRHEVTLVSFVDGSESAEAIRQVSAACHRVETVHLPRLRSWAQAWLGLGSARPSQVSFYRSSRMRTLVRRLLAGSSFDVVFNHTIRMAPYVLDVQHPRKVLWLGDSLGLALGRSLPFEPAWKRPGIAWERRRVDRFEADISQGFLETWALSPVDRDDMVRIGCHHVVLVTHGVDERLYALKPRPASPPRVLFLGNLSVPHNMDAALYAAREIWPAVRREVPGAELVLAGANPAPAVRRLGALAGVSVPGLVPDLCPLWESTSVLLAPLRFSTGIQNKVLEAMAAGVPVVTTPPVAEALGARHGEHLLVADSVAGLAGAVVGLLRDMAGSAPMTVRARELVRRGFSWDNAVRRLEQLAGAGTAR
jgi:glycosyltransferase involved in cell wall biosynthesis